MSTALVSIVVATYRTPAAMLRVTLASALAQRWPALEVLVADDSPDQALAAVVQALNDPRLHYQHNQPPLGAAGNHWAAFARARGEFLVVLNHDDWLAPEFVPRLAAALQAAPQTVLAFCDHWVIDANGRQLLEASRLNSQHWGRSALPPGQQTDVLGLVVRQSLPIAMGTLFRRSALPNELPEGAGPAYDLWLSYLLTRQGGAVHYEAERLSAWRSHDNNLTAAAGAPWLNGSARCWEAMSIDAAFVSVRPLVRQKAAAARLSCALRAWADGLPREARAQVRRSWQWRASGRAALIWAATWLPNRWAPKHWRPTLADAAETTVISAKRAPL